MASQTITALGNAIINLVDRKTPIATASTVGMVKPDGSTINIDANGVISSNGGGTSRNIGEIVSSTVPLTDAGLHLLDGALIDGAGIYSDFVSYMADLYGDGTDVPSYFCSQADWETAVNTYGVCGKFVYNSTNNTVRLPKITGIVEGTTDVTALGDLVEAGLPNIIGRLDNACLDRVSANGAFYKSGYNSGTGYGGNSYTDTGVALDASRASSIYGNSTTVQPQTIKAFYYIVIATSTKTDIQVDLDNVTTEINNMVSKEDLIEFNINSYVSTIIADVMPDLTAGINVGGNTTYTTPSTGWLFARISGDWTNYFGNITVNGTLVTAFYGYEQGRGTDNVWIPISKGDVIVLAKLSAAIFYPSKGVI